MSNTFFTESLIPKQVITELVNNLTFARTINRQFQDTFSNLSGQTVNVRIPTRYTTNDGADVTSQKQAITQRVVPLTIDQRNNVAVEISSAELALNLDDKIRTIINPAMLQLANKIDQTLYQQLSLQVYNAVGTAGSLVSTPTIINDARVNLSTQGATMRPRRMLLNPLDSGALSNSLQSGFNTMKFNQGLLNDGEVGHLNTFDIYEVQNTIQSILADDDVGSPVMDGATLTGATELNMTGFTNGVTVFKGSIFTIAGVGAVNPITRSATGLSMQFVTTDDFTADGSGDAVVPISPTIVFDTGNPYNNVTALPLTTAEVTFQDSHSVNLAYCPDAFTLAMVKLPEINQRGAFMKTMTDKDAGISVRMAEYYDGDTDQLSIRFDVYYGMMAFPAFGATRVMGYFDPTLNP